jgi:hypothetical protein
MLRERSPSGVRSRAVDQPWVGVIHNGFITSDDRAIGSIVKVGNKWLVEILWSGPTGDIKFEAESITGALAFINGVEKTFEAFTGSEAP